MANRGKDDSTVQHSSGIRTMRRVGVCLASVSSILVLAGPASAAAHEVNSAYQARNGHFDVKLTGGEVPGGGDRGQGSGTLDLKPQEEKACYTITWKGLRGDVTALHLHIAARGDEGPHAIDFFNNQHFPGQQSSASGCVPATRDKINAVINRPADYYLNVHSTEYPKGALRGQLN
jgi:hypothetical protein